MKDLILNILKLKKAYTFVVMSGVHYYTERSVTVKAYTEEDARKLVNKKHLKDYEYIHHLKA